MRREPRLRFQMRISLLIAIFASASWAGRCEAVLFAETGDPVFNTAAPGGEYLGSGWDLQGSWSSFLGTPIAPQYFITAAHVRGTLGDAFSFRGQAYVTDAFFDDTESDLRIWHVTTPFPAWAEIYRGGDEAGQVFVVFGRGTQRGKQVTTVEGAAGWEWGASDGLMRWGTNQVTAVENLDGNAVLAAEFNLGVAPTEAHLSVGDSGGGVFLRDLDGIWRLAGVNYSVSGRYSIDATGVNPFDAALFDQSNLFVETAPGFFEPAGGPGKLYMTQIASRREFIETTTGIPEPSSWGLLFLGAVLFFATVPLRDKTRAP